MKDEKILEKQLLKIGILNKKSDALQGVKLDVGTLTKFIKNKFRPVPERLADVEDYVVELAALLVKEGAKFFITHEPEKRLPALRRLIIWEVWEGKYQRQDFADIDAGTAVTGIKKNLALRQALNDTAGHIINHLAKGDYKLDEVSKDRVWKVFAEFAEQIGNVYLIEPLRRMGLLEAPPEETEEEEAA